MLKRSIVCLSALVLLLKVHEGYSQTTENQNQLNTNPSQLNINQGQSSAPKDSIGRDRGVNEKEKNIKNFFSRLFRKDAGAIAASVAASEPFAFGDFSCSTVIAGRALLLLLIQSISPGM
jgi:hypothetical protein